MRSFLLRVLILTLCWSLVYAPIPPVQAWAPKSPSATALGQLNELAGLELQATSLMSNYNAALKTFDQLFFEAFMVELDPWLQENLPKLLADESPPPAPPLPAATLPAAPVASAPAKPSVAKPLGTMAPPAPVDAVTPPPGVTLNTLSPAKIAALQTAWSELQTQAQQLNAVEELINVYPPLLYPLYAKMKDEQTARDAGILRFLQITVHTVTRRLVGDAVTSPFPEVRKLDGCQGGLMGSHAFYQALQAAADGSDTLGQGDVQKLLHQQHACLDPQTSLRHEVAYVAALEIVEGALHKNNVSHWYPKFSAANVPVVLTLWDGKQWWGPTPYYNWLQLNQPAIVPALSNTSGLYAFDRTANAMVKLHLCGNAPAAGAVGNNAGTVKKKPAPLAQNLKRTGTVLKTLPYQKHVYQGASLPPAIDPNLSYTPYGSPWSGDEKDWCTGEQFIPVAPIQAACLEPQVLLDRLTDPKAWGLGNCTIAEFVNAGLICPPPRGQCAAPYGLKDPKLKPVPAIPFALSHGKTLLQCLVANVQPPQDPLLKCAAQASGKNSGGGQSVYTPGSTSCGFNPIGDDVEGGSEGTDTEAGDDDDGTDGGEKKKKKEGAEEKKPDDAAGVTVSPDGVITYPPHVISGDRGPGAEPESSKGKSGIDTGGQKSGADRTAPPFNTGKDPAWMDTPGEPKGRGSNSSDSSNGTTNGSEAEKCNGSNPSLLTESKFGPPPTLGLGKNILDSESKLGIMKYFGGSEEKFDTAWRAHIEMVQKFLITNKTFQNYVIDTLNVYLKKLGFDQIDKATFINIFVIMAISNETFGYNVSKLLTPDDMKNISAGSAEGGGYGGIYFGYNSEWNLAWHNFGGKLYGFPKAGIVFGLGGDPDYKKGWIYTIVIHEFLHAVLHRMIANKLLSKSFIANNVENYHNMADFEHIWIYSLYTKLLQLLTTSGIIQSSFDPKNFPHGPDGTQQPGTMVAGDIAFVSVGPKVHDTNGVHDRYPNSAAMCADDASCGGSCTVGQAQAAAFNDCILQAAGTSGGGGTVAPTPGGPDPSPMDDDAGSLPACADEDFGGTDADNSSCVATDCPADNPDCCKKKTGSGAPWAIDPSLTMQQCYAMYCGEGQADCPCGGMASSKAWFMKGQPAAQPAPMQKKLQPANTRGQQKSLPGNP